MEVDVQIKVRGYENNRPILHTYNLSDLPIAEAIAESREGLFSIGASLDQKLQYALVYQGGEFFGMVTLFSDPHRALLSTFLRASWTPGVRFQVHVVREVEKQFDY
jgi:hypothetical protein